MAQPSSEDTRIGLIVLAVLCGVGVFVWWMMRLGRDPVQRAAPTHLVDGQVVRFDPGRDAARPKVEYDVTAVEECDFGMVPRAVVRVLAPSTTSAMAGLEIAKAEIRKAARRRPYCAFMVFLSASDQKDITGEPWALAAYDCAMDGEWALSADAFPSPDYGQFAIKYRALADRGLLPGGR